MRTLPPEYMLEITAAQSMLEQLQSKLQEVEERLKSDPLNTTYCRELRKLCLEITITENEIEHIRQKSDL